MVTSPHLMCFSHLRVAFALVTLEAPVCSSRPEQESRHFRLPITIQHLKLSRQGSL